MKLEEYSPEIQLFFKERVQPYLSILVRKHGTDRIVIDLTSNPQNIPTAENMIITWFFQSANAAESIYKISVESGLGRELPHSLPSGQYLFIHAIMANKLLV